MIMKITSMAYSDFMEKVFPEQVARQKAGLCPTCGGKITEFRNTISQKEFEISGMCQKCQDEVFGED